MDSDTGNAKRKDEHKRRFDEFLDLFSQCRLVIIQEKLKDYGAVQRELAIAKLTIEEMKRTDTNQRFQLLSADGQADDNASPQRQSELER
ncbi:hypothetical protein QFC21_004927 [Naganishia friedmannii]|uniref:Uncharacterized protein n=1 Tax=Naganishia friedmannii TaxID=89922 RepID=A0ACC2VDR2_9TREE|nr:hypothetical protein QFC21_004927 [Naganishia friedmannii]